MILTILEAQLPPGGAESLQGAYAAAGAEALPPAAGLHSFPPR